MDEDKPASALYNVSTHTTVYLELGTPNTGYAERWWNLSDSGSLQPAAYTVLDYEA